MKDTKKSQRRNTKASTSSSHRVLSLTPKNASDREAAQVRGGKLYEAVSTGKHIKKGTINF